MVHADMMMSLFALGVTCREFIGAGLNRKREVITKSRNALVREALALEEITHLMWIDSDHMFPNDGLRQLIRRDKDIVGAFYEKRQSPYGMVGEFAPDQAVMKDKGLRRAVIIPGGFVLIRREVYERLASPWYREDYSGHGKSADNPDGLISEDVYFCRSAHEAGYELWCDLDLSHQIWHMGVQHVPFGGPLKD